MTPTDKQIDDLAKIALAKYKEKLDKSSNSRLLIAISGIPGSGKTTTAKDVYNRINATIACCAFIPMDGFHLTRKQLSEFPDPAEAFRRRGAAFTFNAADYLKLVERLRAPITPETSTIYAPSFSHALKDPVPNEISIEPFHRILIFEGLYLSLNEAEWKEAAEMMDQRWFIEVDEMIARERVIARHLETGVELTREAAEARVDGSDLVNGREIVAKRGEVDEIIPSLDWGVVEGVGLVVGIPED